MEKYLGSSDFSFYILCGQKKAFPLSLAYSACSKSMSRGSC